MKGVDRRGLAVGAALAVAYTWMGWRRHTNGWSGGFDLGVFDHSVWRLSKGLGTYSSVLDRSLLTDHLSPVLFVLPVLYLVAATPLWLFAVQGVAIGATVLPMRALARELEAPAWLATLALVLSPGLLAAGLFDFHPSTLAVPLVAAALLGAVRDDRLLTVLCIVGVALCRSELVVVAVAVAIIRWNRATRWALLVVPVALLATAVVSASHGNMFWDMNYPALGDGPVDAVLHPWRFITALGPADAGSKLLWWLLPGGFLVLARPRWALGMVVAMAPVLLSEWGGTAEPYYHHSALAVPFVLGGALELIGRRPDLTILRPVLVGGSVVALLVASPLGPGAPDEQRLPQVLVEEAHPGLDRLLDRIGPDDRVSAINTVAAQLSHRRDVRVWPTPFLASIPPELGMEADPDEAARIDVVVVTEADRDFAEEQGFEIEAEAGGLVLGRRPGSRHAG